MARWNVSGDTVTLEEGRRRSPARWFRRNALRIAIVLGVVEAIVAWRLGWGVAMVVVGLLAVLGYISVRDRVPHLLRRPLWVVAVAQGVAGLLPLALGAGLLIASMIGALLLVILLLVVLGDRRR